MKKNKPSATAFLIFKVVLFQSHDKSYSHLVSPTAAKLSQVMAQEILSFPNLFNFAISNKICRWILKLCEKWLNPGFILHVNARKKLIEKLSKQAITEGYKQIIILGAGFDTLGLRIANEEKGVMCFEIDHPSTHEWKRCALSKIKVPDNLILIPANLATHSLTHVLTQHSGFDNTKLTLVIIEGVLMYLSRQEVEKLFKELRGLFSHGLRCIFTFMEERPNGDIQFKTANPLVDWWLKRKQEQFLWGIKPEALLEMTKNFGFKNVTFMGKNEFLSEFFSTVKPVPQLAEGEYVCIANS